MPLHLDNLRDSVEALNELLQASEDEARMGQLSEIERIGIRAGVVKHFEITYELSWKLMARWLKTNVGAETADGLTKRQLFRLSMSYKLISDVDRWMRHHDARNTTSHMYDRERAEQVYEAVRDFTNDAWRLLRELEARND
ncbi:MAG: HI0074 family nucleotidyltransferase substrate-binding subunit [Caldilineaceae bacterium]|nr:HI0074 family nucleotidyltransferase substrate-binding subunit [Caldilineaceae bacterium]